MFKTALWPMQEAIYKTLTDNAALMAAINGVFDADVDKGTNCPYIVLGDDTANDYGSKTTKGEDVTHTLHVFSDYQGKKQAKEILDKALQALTANPITINGGFAIDGISREMCEVFGPENGIYHGVMRLRIYIKQN